MESLARLVAIIMGSVLVLGLMAVLAARSSSGSVARRVIGLIIGVAAFSAGGSLALLDIGLGGRGFGFLVCLSGLAAIFVNLRSKKE